MKKGVRIITSIFVLAAILFFVAGHSLDYFVFKYRQAAIRNEIKEQIEIGVEEDEYLKFSALEILNSNLEWEKPGKEFRKNGMMYDIVKLKLENGKCVYYCVNDEKEERLFEELDQLVQNRLNEDEPDDYLEDLEKDFIKLVFTTTSNYTVSYSEIRIMDNYSFGFSNGHFHLNTPPPEV